MHAVQIHSEIPPSREIFLGDDLAFAALLCLEFIPSLLSCHLGVWLSFRLFSLRLSAAGPAFQSFPSLPFYGSGGSSWVMQQVYWFGIQFLFPNTRGINVGAMLVEQKNTHKRTFPYYTREYSTSSLAHNSMLVGSNEFKRGIDISSYRPIKNFWKIGRICVIIFL